ncbi:MAG TPA: FKBP-type peptidyl-prolyl cis-trans isomerase [Labilithrix sp.]|nr:FKBP-type peptidyl-prolyl cis-trans isomerase [Labilithrix sp.]
MRNVVWVMATLAVTAVGSMSSGCSKRVEEPPQADFKPSEAPPLPPGPDKLEIVDEVVGTGAEAKKDDKIKVHYTGTLMNGKMFDSSRGKDPFPVTIGAGQVIKGWDQGLPGMRVGGKRKLTIPWQDAYGEKGSPPSIPPKAALKFDVELLEIVSDDAKDAGTKDAGPSMKLPAQFKPAGAKK